MNTTAPNSPQRKAQALLVSALTLALLTLATPSCGKIKEAQTRANMAESVSNSRQIKLIMDSFAMDNDGKYPSAETAAEYDLPSPVSSNDYFRQLFVTGDTGCFTGTGFTGTDTFSGAPAKSKFLQLNLVGSVFFHSS